VNVGGVLVLVGGMLVGAVLGIVTVSGAGRRIPELLDVVDVGYVCLDVLATRRDVVHGKVSAAHRGVEVPLHARAHRVSEQLHYRLH